MMVEKTSAENQTKVSWRLESAPLGGDNLACVLLAFVLGLAVGEGQVSILDHVLKQYGNIISPWLDYQCLQGLDYQHNLLFGLPTSH